MTVNLKSSRLDVLEKLVADNVTKEGKAGCNSCSCVGVECDDCPLRNEDCTLGDVRDELSQRLQHSTDCLWLKARKDDVIKPCTCGVINNIYGDKTPSHFLRDAANTLDERGKQYDSKGAERSMEKTVFIFNVLTGSNLTTAQGWQFMKVLKDVRLWSNTDEVHVDSIIDNLGYTALLAEEVITLNGKLKATE